MKIKPVSRQVFPAFLAISALLSTQTQVRGQEINSAIVHAMPPFSLKDDAVKPNTAGVDVDKLISLLSKQKPTTKSEFETNAEFNLRTQESTSRFIPSALADGKYFAVTQSLASFPNLSLSGRATTKAGYSPETETMSVSIDSWLGCLPLRRTTTPKRKYIAKNGFGQQVTVLEADISETCIELPDSEKFKIDDLGFSFNVPRAEAEKVKSRLTVFLIGKLIPPFSKTETEHIDPTGGRPLELHTIRRSLVMSVADVWIVDMGTGKVLAKHNIPFFNSTPYLIGGFRPLNGCKGPSYGKSEVPSFDLVVEMAINVRANGEVASTSVLRSTGIPSLDSKAVSSVSRCKFRPAMSDGRAIDGVATVKFHFDAYNAGGY